MAPCARRGGRPGCWRSKPLAVKAPRAPRDPSGGGLSRRPRDRQGPAQGRTASPVKSKSNVHRPGGPPEVLTTGSPDTPGAPPTSLSSWISMLPWAGNLCLLKETRYSSPAGGGGQRTQHLQASLPGAPASPGTQLERERPAPASRPTQPEAVVPPGPGQRTRRPRGQGGCPGRGCPASLTSDISNHVRAIGGLLVRDGNGGRAPS